MKYERLTKRTINGYGISRELVNQKQPAVDIAIDSFDIVVNRLAELEDKIERGELVENKVVTYINMARSDSKALIDKAIKYDNLKNKIENGTLIELPCKVGDTVYHIDCYPHIFEDIVDEIWINGYNEVCYDFRNGCRYLASEFGVKWFTAKAKAKQN